MPLSLESMLVMMVQPDLGQMGGIVDESVHLGSLIVSGQVTGTNMLCFTHWHRETLFSPLSTVKCMLALPDAAVDILLKWDFCNWNL